MAIISVWRAFPVDPGYDCGAAQDDWDMWLRLTRVHGWRVRQVDQASAVYHRVPDEASMTGEAATTIAGIRRFAAGHELLHRRYPVARGSAADRARRLPHAMYRLVEERLAAGLPVSHYYYERSLPVFAAAVHGDLAPDDAVDALQAAVDPAKDDPKSTWMRGATT